MNFSLSEISFPISLRPLRVSAFPPKRVSFRVNITDKKREYIRFREQADDFYEKNLKALPPKERKKLAGEWIKKYRIDKKKKEEPVDFGDVLGKGKHPLIDFMLIKIGVRAMKTKLEEQEKENKKKEEEKPKKKKEEEEEEKPKKKKEEDEEEKIKQMLEEEKPKKKKEEEEEDEEEKIKQMLEEDDARKQREEEKKEEKEKKEEEEKKDEEEIKQMLEKDDARKQREEAEKKAKEKAEDLLCLVIVLLALKNWL